MVDIPGAPADFGPAAASSVWFGGLAVVDPTGRSSTSPRPGGGIPVVSTRIPDAVSPRSAAQNTGDRDPGTERETPVGRRCSCSRRNGNRLRKCMYRVNGESWRPPRRGVLVLVPAEPALPSLWRRRAPVVVQPGDQPSNAPRR